MDVRRTIEDRHEGLLPNLYLGEVPDGWLGIVERFLDDAEAEVPKALRDGDSFSLDFKEKWGDIRISWFVDHHDLAEGKSFLAWLKRRVTEAEKTAEKTCAKCGATGREAGVDFTTSGWILPLCRRHRIMREGKL